MNHLKLRISNKWISVMVSLFLLMQLTVGLTSSYATSADAPDLVKSMEGAGTYLLNQNSISDWGAFALAQAGRVEPNGYADKLYQEVLDKTGARPVSVTEYERIALAVKSIGGDPQNIAGVDLIQTIANHSRMINQGTLGPVFGLYALDSGSYSIAADAVWNPSKLVAWLLAQQKNGGWPLSEGEANIVDVTAMVVTALAPHKAEEGVQKAIDAALTWLSAKQTNDGGFSDFGANSEYVSQVIIALSALGIDAREDKDFIKPKGDLITNLLSYQQSDGGFAHSRDGKSNVLASEQALQALAALHGLSLGQGKLFYRIQPAEAVNIRIEGPQSVVAKGSAVSGNALGAMIQILNSQGISYHLADFQGEKYVDTIQGIHSGSLGGFDGWLFSVNRNGQIIYPTVGMSQFPLLKNDEITVYYGDDSTQLIHSIQVDPAQPRAGQAFQVKIQQSKWNWDANRLETSPAEGVTVTIGKDKITADHNGIAQFSGEAEGSYSITISGYKDGKVPNVVPSSSVIKVAPMNKKVTVQVEGPQSPIASGSFKSASALEALTHVLDKANVSYHIQDSSFGKYVDEINHLHSGLFGGFDGWFFQVLRNGTWLFPAVGISDFTIEDGDLIDVYYGGDATQTIESVQVRPLNPKVGEPVMITVNKEQWNWDNNRADISPAAGVSIQVGTETKAANSKGEARFEHGLSGGNNTITVSGYLSNAAPGTVRFEHTEFVYRPYHDESDISGWAQPYVIASEKYGLMNGNSISDKIFAPQKMITRAEFVTLLVKLLGETLLVGQSTGFTDVQQDSWYNGYIAIAKDKGIVSGTDEHTFAPNEPITREDMAILLSRALHLEVDENSLGVSPFTDLKTASLYATSYIQAVNAKGLMVGSSGMFMPKSYATREMAAVIAVKAFKELQ